MYPNATLSNHGTLDLRGYLKSVDANGEYKREDNGSRCYNLNGAKTYSPFVVDDYGGGSSTVGNYLAGNICPFNGFEMPNLQTTFFNNGKSELYGWADLYTSAMKNAVLDLPAKHNRCSPKVIGSSEAIINLNSNSILSVRYSPKYATSSGSQIKGTTVNDWGTGRTFDSSGNENPSGRYKMNITGGANSGRICWFPWAKEKFQSVLKMFFFQYLGNMTFHLKTGRTHLEPRLNFFQDQHFLLKILLLL